MESNYSKTIRGNIAKIYDKVGTEVFGNSKVIEILNCSESTATNYLNRMYTDLQIINLVEGAGKGKYRFIE